MPAHSKRPSPPARISELLAQRKRAMLDAKGFVTEEDFEACWDACWAVMVTERAWPHATSHRRAWRSAMVACKPEYKACFLGVPTGFHRYLGALAEAMDRSMVAGDEMLVGQLVA